MATATTHYYAHSYYVQYNTTYTLTTPAVRMSRQRRTRKVASLRGSVGGSGSGFEYVRRDRHVIDAILSSEEGSR